MADVKKKSAKKPAAKPWAGRFAKPTDADVEAFMSSVAYDRRLAAHDIAGSRAHARMLAAQRIITKGELAEILAGLKSIEKEMSDGAFKWRAADEDVHMAVERRLIELVGPVGGKLHTARSRNDQIALDLRLYVREQARALTGAVCGLVDALVAQAKANRKVVMPGYTHLQRAQPVLLAHHLAAHAFALLRDVERFQAAWRSADAMPLGSAALAGTSFPIDREQVAAELGFSRLAENSMDAVADRDFALDLVYACATCALHLSRLAEELVLWTSGEFGFAVPDDAYATGSSIMPQKKNPDVAELARGKTGRIVGQLTALMTIVKGLPLTYNTDLQEAKEVLIDAVELTDECLPVLAGMVATMTWRPERMRAAAEGGFATATELADYLAGKGLPFRQAHAVAGRAVKACEQQGRALTDLKLPELKKLSPLFEGDVLDALSVESAVARRTSDGGTAPRQVASELRTLRTRLDKAAAWAEGK
jgi:argininosuccinate lyase